MTGCTLAYDGHREPRLHPSAAPRDVVIGETRYRIEDGIPRLLNPETGSTFSIPHPERVAIRRVAELEDAIQAAIAEHDDQADAWSDDVHGDADNAAYHRERAALLRSALVGTPSDHGE